ncbi:uncharacterized protein LY79DRAFT_594685 [Colletotrichum navitas]|uniref:Uncharacterized protein n=1 Tax=Colletotrichum navitas TaxID=681940 RepID=A0AAD8UZG2_9PEZI|nr:uncharacterized protein LY79DRAFT_594685 [Colletotrichum navitas]KAK1569764.1 hypothetical protein LY79DRAFT_594685 [Colletotrichum navitas]
MNGPPSLYRRTGEMLPKATMLLRVHSDSIPECLIREHHNIGHRAAARLQLHRGRYNAKGSSYVAGLESRVIGY